MFYLCYFYCHLPIVSNMLIFLWTVTMITKIIQTKRIVGLRKYRPMNAAYENTHKALQQIIQDLVCPDILSYLVPTRGKWWVTRVYYYFLCFGHHVFFKSLMLPMSADFRIYRLILGLTIILCYRLRRLVSCKIPIEMLTCICAHSHNWAGIAQSLTHYGQIDGVRFLAKAGIFLFVTTPRLAFGAHPTPFLPSGNWDLFPRR